MTFHSGNPLTANDVAYTMQRLLDMGEGFGYLFSSTIEAVNVIDDTTVEFVCTRLRERFLHPWSGFTY